MVLVTAPAETPRPARPTTLAEAGRLPLVDFPPTWAIRHEVDKAFRAAAVEHTTTFEVNDILAAGDLVRYGLGVCVMPPSLAARFPELPTRPFAAQAPSWTLRVIHTRGEQPPAVAALLRHVR